MAPLTVEQIADALMKKGGNITEAAAALKVTRQAIHQRIVTNETLQAALIEARETVLDITESAALKQIRKGNTAMIIFTLKTLGKERGYVERNEITGKDGGPIETRDVSELSDEELARIASGSRAGTT